MNQWIWQAPGWPNLTFKNKKLDKHLSLTRAKQSRLLGMVSAFPQTSKLEIHAQMLSSEMITSSAIEGEHLDRASVRSSIEQRLGIKTAGLSLPPDRYIEGLLDIMIDACEHYKNPLTLTRIFGWQAALFPTGYSGIKPLVTGDVRGPGCMQIISGQPGKVTVHFEAPPHETLHEALSTFLTWFNTHDALDGLIRAGLAHLWFEILHPFDDVNGRVGRAIIDLALAQDENLSTRFYSLSKTILAHRKSYYRILEATTKNCSLDVTDWLIWFLEHYSIAVDDAIKQIDIVLLKSKFWLVHSDTALNARQKKVLNKLLDAGKDGFEGGMTTRKYVSLTKVSRATAYRELIDMVEKNCLIPLSTKGRSSAYGILWQT